MTMSQKIEPMSDDDLAPTHKQRTWVMGHYESDGERLYATLEGKLSLLDTILRENWIEPDETWKLHSLGISFGDALL
jgi:hypothetical protein